jgi:hypothetical protein
MYLDLEAQAAPLMADDKQPDPPDPKGPGRDETPEGKKPS